MSYHKSIVFYVTFFLIMGIVISQECKTSGEYCRDTDMCCGGCCRNQICIDTYDSCKDHDDPCLSHLCPPGLECHIYQPDCKGCEAEPYCS